MTEPSTDLEIEHRHRRRFWLGLVLTILTPFAIGLAAFCSCTATLSLGVWALQPLSEELQMIGLLALPIGCVITLWLGGHAARRGLRKLRLLINDAPPRETVSPLEDDDE